MHDGRPKGSITSPKLPCGGLGRSLHWRNMSPQLSAPRTVLISGQLQFSGWRLPVSVPFANFSSQGRHKTLGAPAAVHPNPVSSTSLDHTRGRQPASVWPWFGASVQEILTHGAKEPAGSLCCSAAHMCELQCTAVVKCNLCVILRMMPHAPTSFTQIPSEGRLREYCLASSAL